MSNTHRPSETDENVVADERAVVRVDGGDGLAPNGHVVYTVYVKFIFALF